MPSMTHWHAIINIYKITVFGRFVHCRCLMEVQLALCAEQQNEEQYHIAIQMISPRSDNFLNSIITKLYSAAENR